MPLIWLLRTIDKSLTLISGPNGAPAPLGLRADTYPRAKPVGMCPSQLGAECCTVQHTKGFALVIPLLPQRAREAGR